ncbi:MAG: NRAMP family divalent metal transporter [Armatimonadota bacterium]
MKISRRWSKLVSSTGPGIVTGSADNDPAGISTYSIMGASTGYIFLWMGLLVFPLMVAIQDISARIGAVREEGLGSVIQDTFGRRWFTIVLIALMITNVTTIGADLAGIGAALQLITGISLRWFIIPVALVILYTQIFWSYHIFAKYLKIMTLVLLAYVGAAFLSKPDWKEVLYYTFIPHFNWDTNSLAIVTAMLGTTISPYMFFWQASQEVEEIKDQTSHPVDGTGSTAKSEKWRLFDTVLGMFYSSLIAYFIILTSASTLHEKGVVINTATEAAQALRPVAGEYAYLLFSIGLAGAGLLAIPVLAGSTAYPVAEWLGCAEGLDKPVRYARCFYATITISVLVGIAIALLSINPIKALFYSQVLMGLLTPIILVFILLIGQNKEIMGNENVNTPFFTIFGWLTMAIMTFVDIMLIYHLFR